MLHHPRVSQTRTKRKKKDLYCKSAGSPQLIKERVGNLEDGVGQWDIHSVDGND
jgi:hypothetical protein